MTYVTVFNRLARKSLIAYARKYTFAQEDANVNKEKEVCFIPRRSVGLASNLVGGIFARHIKGNKAIKKNLFFSLTSWFSQIQSHIYMLHRIPFLNTVDKHYISNKIICLKKNNKKKLAGEGAGVAFFLNKHRINRRMSLLHTARTQRTHVPASEGLHRRHHNMANYLKVSFINGYKI